MSQPRDDAAGVRQASTPSAASPASVDEDARTKPKPKRDPAFRMTRRTWTLVFSMLLVAVFGLLGAFVRVPYVALGPGPTYDTLGASDEGPVVQVDGQQTFPSNGELRMTTVSLTDDMTLFSALGVWVSGRYALAPREEYYPPGNTEEQIKEQNTRQFQDSQSNAEVAALRKLGYPVKVLAQDVVAGSPADAVLDAGARLINVNGKPITVDQDVIAAMAGTRPGQTIPITFQQDGQPERTEQVTLAPREDGKPEGLIGLQAVDRADVGFEVKIGLEDVGGPSAGLLFALALYDRLTPGELPGGQHIAGTGEITEKGQVGPIGGISFKVVAAKEAGATAFLVPAANCAEAVSAAPDGLQLAKVDTLDSAIAAIEDIKAGRQAPSC